MKGILLDLVSRVSRGRRRSAIMFDIGSARLLRIMSYAVWVSASTHFPLFQESWVMRRPGIRWQNKRALVHKARHPTVDCKSWGSMVGMEEIQTLLLSLCLLAWVGQQYWQSLEQEIYLNAILIIIPKHWAQWDVYCLFVIMLLFLGLHWRLPQPWGWPRAHLVVFK